MSSKTEHLKPASGMLEHTEPVVDGCGKSTSNNPGPPFASINRLPAELVDRILSHVVDLSSLDSVI
jgi:hypothetical protein